MRYTGFILYYYIKMKKKIRIFIVYIPGKKQEILHTLY